VIRSITLISGVLLFAMVGAAADEPRYEIYLGYQYVRANQFNQSSGLATSIGGFDMHGGDGQFVYNFNHWFSGVVDAGAVHKGNIGIPGFDVGISNTTAFVYGGPRFYYRRHHHHGGFEPFGEILFGAAFRHASTGVTGLTSIDTPNIPISSPFGGLFPGPLAVVNGQLTDTQNAFSMKVGGGLDYRFNEHFGFRPMEVDYVLTRFPSLSNGVRENQSSIAASAGFLFTWGGEHAAPAPQMKNCPDGSTVPAGQACPKSNLSVSLAAAATEVCPGETVQIVPTLVGANPSMVGFQWSVNGQNTFQGQNFGFSTEGLQPGTYNIKVMVGGPQFNTATAETSVTVKPYVAPTATVNASPAQIYAGDRSTITATCSGQCGGTLRAPTFASSEGSIQGDQFDSTGVTFDASNNAEQRKTVTITAACADDKNVGNGTTQVEVIKKATVAPIRLPDILFSRDSARVNNCGKRVLLEQLRSYYERDSGGSVALVGHQSSDEKPAGLSAERALNAAAVITAGSGVCLSIPASSVQVSSPGTDQMGVSFDSNFCQSSVPAGPQADERRVVVWFIPSGGQIPASVTNSQAASALSVGNLGCPK
jgi:outer membrane protein OmpA-like peptidoglycan-associated protein